HHFFPRNFNVGPKPRTSQRENGDESTFSEHKRSDNMIALRRGGECRQWPDVAEYFERASAES
ncbi:MAG: hypothetical protein J2P54_13425, partial [Bradyrhizobiaceae bacterium]|nr:hypothetical protein [Bradyrhizobiaceae bacterium]